MATTARKRRPNYDDANSFLMGGESVPSASFLTKGTKHEGEILDLNMRQQLDIDTRKPMFWENGDPKMQLVITLQTEEYDDEIEDDDGRRRLYVKYKMKDAISDAVKEADCTEDGLQVGGWLSVKFVKQDKPQNRAKSGVKHFEAVYEPPDPSAAANAYLDADDPDADEEPEEAPPARGRGRAAAKPAAKATPSAARRRAAAQEPEDEPEDEPPARGRGSRAKAAPARSGSRRTSRSEFVDDGEDEPPY